MSNKLKVGSHPHQGSHTEDDYQRLETVNDDIHFQLSTAQASIKAKDMEIKKLTSRLRYELFASHPCDGKYGDDGEMQCNNSACMIDFKRDSFEEIERKSLASAVGRISVIGELRKEIEQLRQELATEMALHDLALASEESINQELTTCQQERDHLQAEVEHDEKLHCQIARDNLAELYRIGQECANLKAEVERLKLKWRNGKLPQEGFYLFRVNHGMVQYSWASLGQEEYFVDGTEWSGPIEPPEEP